MSEPDRPDGPGLEAFDALYEHEFTYVWQTLGRFGVPGADLPDAVHDVFVVVYRRWSELDPARSPQPWLFGIARRLAATRRRKRTEVLDNAAEPPASVDSSLVDRDLLWRALAELDEDRQAVVILHDLEGRTGLEIAMLLDIPANTVHSRLRLARAQLVAAVERLRGPP